jgi:hypothetical protein
MHVTDGVDVVSALPASGTEVAVVGPSIAILGARGGAIGAHIDGRSVSDEPSGPSKERRVATELPPSCGAFLVGQTVAMTRRYLSRTEVAEWIGVKPRTLGRYLLPAPHALIGTTRGWLPSTIDA